MTAISDVSSHAIARARWRPAEIAFWILAASCAFLFPSRYLIMTDIVRLALFAMSLDLILGYAGIVSLGHAAFYGFGAYTAGLIATVLGFLTSFLVIRGVDLTRLMVTLGISLLLGIGDVAGKYYVPKMGPFVIYTIMIVILIWRPNGLFGRTAAR